MPDSLLNIGLKQIRKLVPVQNEVQLGDDFFIMEVKYSENLQFLKYPCRSDAYIAIFCKSGSLNVEINLRSYTVVKGTLFIGTPGNIIKINRLGNEGDSGFEFIVVAISKEYLSSISFDFKKIFDDRLKLLTEPCVQLEDRNIAFCTKYLDLIGEILSSDVPNKREAVGSLIAVTLLPTGRTDGKKRRKDSGGIRSDGQHQSETDLRAFHDTRDRASHIGAQHGLLRQPAWTDPEIPF